MPIIFEYYDQFCFCWCCEWWWFLLQHSPNWSPSIMKLSLVYSKSRDFGATRGRDNTGKDIQSSESRRSTSFLGKKPTIQVYENLKCWMWIQSSFFPHHYRSETSKLYFIHSMNGDLSNAKWSQNETTEIVRYCFRATSLK